MNDSQRRRPSARALISLLMAGLAMAAPTPADVISGTSGPDVLEGTPQADLINGRGGADAMSGLAGDDTYIVDQAGDTVIEGAGEGLDTIKSAVTYTLPIFVENLTLLGSAVINATGNGLANRLIGNVADNTLNGRAGPDTMRGLAGNDTYIVDDPGDVVSEAPDAGTDTVRSTVTHRMRDNVEKLILTGADAINGTGNDLDNTITGNAARNVLGGGSGNDILNGAGGNDRLSGASGNDRLAGGAGEDIFEFLAALNGISNVDRIADFAPGQDLMRLAGPVFPALTTAGPLPAAMFRLGTTAADATDRILYDPASGAVRYDADGSGPTPPVQFAILTGNPSVTNADFVVVDPIGMPVNYSAQIQPIFTQSCVQCHSGPSAPQGLQLDSQNSYADLVNVTSSQVPGLKRVAPGDDDNSYLVQKIEGTAQVGARMPIGGQLSGSEIALVRRWIAEGAHP